MSDTPPDPAAPSAPPRTPASQKPGFWKFSPPEKGKGPKPMRYDPAAAAAKLRAAAAAKPEPDPGAGDTDSAPQMAAEAPEAATAGEDTGATFADAFGPDDDGGFSAEDYQALAAEYDNADEGAADVHHVVPDDDAEIPSGNAEAARYRHRLRDAKAELAATKKENDALRGRLDTLHRAEAQRLASPALIDPAELWRDGAGLDDIRDRNGNIDPDAVRKLADAVVAAHPHAARASRSTWGRHGSGASALPTESQSPAWAQAFAPRKE